MSTYTQYTTVSYSGIELLKRHSLDEYGIWQVYGEDPNCDFGGHHYQPELGIYEGKLVDIIHMSVQLKGFWTWGGGGDIKKKNITKIDPSTIALRNTQRARLKELEAETEKLRKDLSLI